MTVETEDNHDKDGKVSDTDYRVLSIVNNQKENPLRKI
jgi:hypothetical protein